MNRPFGEKPSVKKGLSYICLLTLLVLLFYWEGVGGYFCSLDMLDLRFVVNHAQGWYHHSEVWRPVYYTLRHLVYISFGLNPVPYHLLSLTLYVSILLLLYYFYNQLQDNRTLSKVAVLLFASFYLNAEAVVTIRHQKDLLCVFFSVAVLIYFSRYRKTQSLRCYALALFFGVLATLSKETSVCLPLLLLMVDYHISCGTFPPKLPPLKDLRQGLLPHVPFWLMALALFIFSLMIPESPLPLGLVGLNTLSSLLDHVYWMWIYSLSPCFITDRLTIILAFSIAVGLVWLFCRFTAQRRSLIVTMVACIGFSLLPFVEIGPIPRYFILPSVFSMFLITLLAFEIGSCVYRLFEERWGYRFYPDRSVTFLVLLILLPAIYQNYQHVRQYNKNSVYAGRMLREIVEGTIRILPKGPGASAIIYLNLPNTVQSKAVLSLDCYVAFINTHIDALDLYCRHHDVPWADFKWEWWPENENLKTVYLDLGYDRVSLDSRAWYSLLKAHPFAVTISAEELDTISKNRGNRVLFFNPMTNQLMDVSGWTYKELAESVVPYRDRLNRNPPNLFP